MSIGLLVVVSPFVGVGPKEHSPSYIEVLRNSQANNVRDSPMVFLDMQKYEAIITRIDSNGETNYIEAEDSIKEKIFDVHQFIRTQREIISMFKGR